MAANSWFRVWLDMVNDPKWRTIARASGQSIGNVQATFLHLLTSAAANATERGRTQSFSCEDVASALDVEAHQVEAILAAMQGRVIDGDRILAWEERQPLREDGSAERGKAWREKKKAERAAVDERNRTQPNARKRPDSDADSDAEEPFVGEVGTSPAPPTAVNPADVPPTVPDFGMPSDVLPTPGHEPSIAGLICRSLKDLGIWHCNPSHPELLALIQVGANQAEFEDAATDAVLQDKADFRYVVGMVRGRRADAARRPQLPVATGAAIRAGPHASPKTIQALQTLERMTHEPASAVVSNSDRARLPAIDLPQPGASAGS